jgi:hypothetical protein
MPSEWRASKLVRLKKNVEVLWNFKGISQTQCNFKRKSPNVSHITYQKPAVVAIWVKLSVLHDSTILLNSFLSSVNSKCMLLLSVAKHTHTHARKHALMTVVAAILSVPFAVFSRLNRIYAYNHPIDWFIGRHYKTLKICLIRLHISPSPYLPTSMSNKFFES